MLLSQNDKVDYIMKMATFSAPRNEKDAEFWWNNILVNFI